jgi:23S rRNA pseudouridine2457 synthase
MKGVLFYKPFGVMSSFTDPQGRKTLKDFVDVKGAYAAGRLDYDSEGLLLLTDDGELIHRLTDPRFDHPKTYLVQVEGIATETQVKQMREGVVLRGERTKPAEVEIVIDPDVPFRKVRDYHPTTWLRVNTVRIRNPKSPDFGQNQEILHSERANRTVLGLGSC